MADANEPALESGTYEVIRRRLGEQAQELRTRLERLNAGRIEVFGGGGTTMLSTQRVRTEHNCVPRDLVRISGEKILLGYHVHLGLKSTTEVGDVFAKIALRDGQLQPAELELLKDPTFGKDFREIFQYYKEARLTQLRRTDTHLLMVFQTGERASDLKVLRWGVAGEMIKYLDNRGERDHVLPPSHDFAWVRATREMHRAGAHPHINIADRIFVECIGGDLTIKVEDNTSSGAGVYAEPVEDASQGLDDADIGFADLESAIILKIRPYREERYRYFFFNKQTEQAVRCDALGHSCQQLPEGHGLIFPNGFHLADGTHRVYPVDAQDMAFIRVLRAPNGEDVAYVYHHRDECRYHILQYNLITREVTTPLVCNGYCFYPDGRLVLFRADPEPQRLHAMQIWQTPFCTEEHDAARKRGDGSFLATLGNRDLVRGISDGLNVVRLIGNQRPTVQVYVDLLAGIERMLDAYHWLDHAEACGLREQLLLLKATADQALGEFEKVRQLTAEAAQRCTQLETEARALFRQIAISGEDGIDAQVAMLAQLRAQRGRIDAARAARYIDTARLDALDAEVVKKTEQLSAATVATLGRDEALRPYHLEIAGLETQIAATATAVALQPIGERLAVLSQGLDLLLEIVNGLSIADATARTAILERIGEVYGLLNRARALHDGRKGELGTREGRAEFTAQFTLLGQSVAGALALCATVEKTDELLARMLVQIEELEARYIEFPEFADRIQARRDEISASFQTRKQSLLDERNRRAESLARSAERVLTSVRSRALGFASNEELGAFLAADPMVLKLRAVAKDLRELGDTVKADEVEARLKAVREDATRTLRDKNELFEEGDLLRLGKHRFSVNRQPLELAIVPRGEGMAYHLTGTGYYESIESAEFLQAKELWPQELVSENHAVYRGEYLAYCIWQAAEQGSDGLSPRQLDEACRDLAALTELVRGFARQQYDEGYERGLHDHDAALILHALHHLAATAGLLRHAGSARALALLWWRHAAGDGASSLHRRCRSMSRLRRTYGPPAEEAALAADCARLLHAFAVDISWPEADAIAPGAAAYLVAQLGEDTDAWALSGEAETLRDRCLEHCRLHNQDEPLRQDLAGLADDPAAAVRTAGAWLDGFLAQAGKDLAAARDEALVALLTAETVPRATLHARSHVQVTGLLGRHPRIAEQALELDLPAFLHRLARYVRETVPAYRAFQELRRRLLAAERARLRLDEFKPLVLTSFVRNKLIDQVYLPLIGDNLAKQIGAAGAGKRTDLMGLLLLISPPGYGKTTLMEYTASVLGLTFVKVNGPALGHRVKSLDPAEAPNATARQELEKVGLALEMGNNVMLYLDDIQHCDPEFLQKFISLCDGQRRIEGVWRGNTRTYDLRGKKFAVVMAGNPYTESGEKFRIPDMLANRADTYNLGDILGGAREAFELSYLENCLGVNPALAPIAGRAPGDLVWLLRLVEGDEAARTELEHPYSALELEEITTVLRHLRRIQGVLLRVNQLYIASASMNDADRTEPAFKLQGSYRNMAKLASKVVAVMTPSELDGLILDHYRSESQTLTTAAEANLLKLRELCGWLDSDGATRWDAIRSGFGRRQEMAGAEDDPVRGALGQLIRVNEGIASVGKAIAAAAEAGRSAQTAQTAATVAGSERSLERLVPLLNELGERIAAATVQAGTAGTVVPKVEVINTLPKYYGKLYQHHIEVLERSLAPTLAAVGRNLANQDAVQAHLKELVQQLRALIQDQERAPLLRAEPGEDGSSPIAEGQDEA